LHVRGLGFFVHRAYPELDFLIERHFDYFCAPSVRKNAEKATQKHTYSLSLVCVFVCVFSFFCGALSREMMCASWGKNEGKMAAQICLEIQHFARSSKEEEEHHGGAHPRRPFVVVVSSAELAREKGAFAFSLRKRL